MKRYAHAVFRHRRRAGVRTVRSFRGWRRTRPDSIPSSSAARRSIAGANGQLPGFGLPEPGQLDRPRRDLCRAISALRSSKRCEQGQVNPADRQTASLNCRPATVDVLISNNHRDVVARPPSSGSTPPANQLLRTARGSSPQGLWKVNSALSSKTPQYDSRMDTTTGAAIWRNYSEPTRVSCDGHLRRR